MARHATRILSATICVTAALAAVAANLLAQAPDLPPTPYMGGPVELVKAPYGAIANKRLLDGIGKVAWTEPTIEKPVDGVWVFGGYGLASISIIDTDEGVIAFDTGDTKHDGEILLEAIRTALTQSAISSRSASRMAGLQFGW